MKNEIGNRFGRLVVVARHNDGGKEHAKWSCLCDCGNTTVVRGFALRASGERGIKSCGCLARENLCIPSGGNAEIERRTVKHGGHSTATYSSWRSMISRCTNPKRKDWDRYGGAGVAVCDRWRLSFAAFRDDMGERPAGKTLDRIKNDRGYEPDNCRWSTSAEQVRNRRCSKVSSINVAEIRARISAGETANTIASAFGISANHVRGIRRGDRWSSP